MYSVPNKPIHTRVSYLYQAATYLTAANTRLEDQRKRNVNDDKHSLPGSNCPKQFTQPHKPDQRPVRPFDAPQETCPMGGQRYLISNLRHVAQKSQIRLCPSLKRSLCKRCDSLLIPGITSTVGLENKSRNGSKPWANVHVVDCQVCGAQKRFHVGMKRQLHRSARIQRSQQNLARTPVDESVAAMEEVGQLQENTQNITRHNVGSL